MGEVDMAKTSLVSIVGGPALSPSLRPRAAAFLQSSGSKQTVLVLSPSGMGTEGARDGMEAAQGGHGRGRDQLEPSPRTEQPPALLLLQHLIFQLFFPV